MLTLTFLSRRFLFSIGRKISLKASSVFRQLKWISRHFVKGIYFSIYFSSYSCFSFSSLFFSSSFCLFSKDFFFIYSANFRDLSRDSSIYFFRLFILFSYFSLPSSFSFFSSSFFVFSSGCSVFLSGTVKYSEGFLVSS